MSSNAPLKSVPVLGSVMAYREAGTPGDPVVLFLHGNPTSSFIWRNIIPFVADGAHCISPDLIGYGASGKPDIDYGFADQARYLEAFIDALGLGRAVIVAQDWGTALAFDLAARRPGFVAGLAFMEFIRPFEAWSDFHQSDQARDLFRKFRTPGEGEALILEGNVFIERVIPNAIVRTLNDDEMNAYRAPFPTPQSRRPTWRFPNELPIAGEPADVHARLATAFAALKASAYPKLLFAGDPGGVVSPAQAEALGRELTDCRLVPLGAGKHYLQEDHPEAIGKAIAGWMRDRGLAKAAMAEALPA